MAVGGNFTNCNCGPDTAACQSPTEPLAAVGLCLADGTPIATAIVRDCAGTVTSEGWINLTTGAWTAGPPPAGTLACGDSRSITTNGTFCDVDPATGDVLGLVLVEYQYAADGSIAAVRLVDAVTGQTYTPVGEVTTCPAGVEQPEQDLVQLCDTDPATGAVTAFVRDYRRDENGAIVGHTDYTLDGQPYTPDGTVGQCVAPCRNPSTLLVCDLPTGGAPTPAVTDTDPASYYPYPTGVPAAGAQELWDGGTLTLPAGTGPQPGTTGSVNSLAATIQALRPVCDNGTAHVTVSVNAQQMGPDDGCASTGHLRLFNGTTQAAITGLPANTPAGWFGMVTVEADVPAADLAAGNIAVALALDAYDDSPSTCTPSPRRTGWQLSAFTVSAAYDQAGCETQFLRTVVTDCETGAVTAVTDTTLDGEPYTVVGEVGQCEPVAECCEAPVPETRLDVETDVLCLVDEASGEVVARVLAEWVYDDQTGERAGQRYVDLATGEETTVPAGAVVSTCPNPDRITRQVCVVESGRSEFLTNEANASSGQDATWQWAPNLTGLWYPMYRVAPNPVWAVTDTAPNKAHWVSPHADRTVCPTAGETSPPVPGTWYTRASWNLPVNVDPATIRIAATVLNADNKVVQWRLNDGAWQPVGGGTFGNPAWTFPPTAVPGGRAGQNEVVVQILETQPAVSCPSVNQAGMMLHVIATYDYEPRVWTQVIESGGQVYYLDENGQRQDGIPQGYRMVPCGGGEGGACCPWQDAETLALCDIAADGTRTAFLRHLTYIEGADTPAVTDTALDGTTPYVPAGTVGVCQPDETEPAPDVEVVQLCDIAPGADPVPFLRHLIYTPGVTAPTVVDTALDGITPYGPTGETGLCQPQEPRQDVETAVLCIRQGEEITREVVVEWLYDDQTGQRTGRRITDPTTGTPVELPAGAELVVCNEPPCPTSFATECVGSAARTEAAYDNTSLIGGVPGRCGSVQGPDGQFPCQPTTGGFTITSWIVNGEEVFGEGGGRAFAGGPCGPGTTATPGMHLNWAQALTNLDPSGAVWSAQQAEGCAWFVGSTGGTRTVYGAMTVEDAQGRRWILGPAQSCEETQYTKVYTQECDGSMSVRWLNAQGVETDAPDGDLVPCGTGCGSGGGRGLDVEVVELCDLQADGTSVPFLRHFTYGSAGQVTAALDTGLDGFSPYTPAGTVTRCQPPEPEPTPDVEVVQLCDLAPGADPVPFLRHLAYIPGATAPTVVDTALDGITPYAPAGTVGACSDQPCGVQSVLEACRCDDTDGDGSADTEYVELLGVDCDGNLASLGAYLPDLTAPYTPVAPVACETPGAPPATTVRAHRVELAPGASWDAGSVPLLQSVTATAHGGTGTVTTADGTSTLFETESVTWSLARDEDAALVGPLTIAAGTGTVTVAWTAAT